MTAFAFGKLSLSRLVGLHPDLLRVVKRALELSEVDFMVVEGLRTLERQRMLVDTGKSTTMNSRHLTGHAVDLCCYQHGELEWGAPFHDQIADAMKAAAAELGVAITWGGDWRSFVDTPHFQLDWKAYPKQAPATPTQAIEIDRKTDTRVIKDQLAKTSSKYKAARRTKQGLGIAGALLVVQQIAVSLFEMFGEWFSVSSLQDLLALASTLSQLGNHLWFAILIGGGTAVWRLMTMFQNRQVDEVKRGTYEPSEGRF